MIDGRGAVTEVVEHLVEPLGMLDRVQQERRHAPDRELHHDDLVDGSWAGSVGRMSRRRHRNAFPSPR